MNSVRRIATNTVTLAISEIISKISIFFIFVYIGRIFGDSTFGQFNFGYSFGLITMMFMDIGINYMIVREMSRKKQSIGDYISNAMLIKVFFTLIISIAVFIIMQIIDKDTNTKLLVYLLCIFAFTRSFTELLFAAIKAHEKMYYEAAIKIISMLALLGLSFLYFINGADIVTIALIFALVEIITFIITFLIVYLKFSRITFNLKISLCKEIIKKAFPFTLSLTSAAIYFNIAVVLLSVLKGDSAAGYYSAAYNLTNAIMFIPGMYIFAIYPIFSKDFKKLRKKVTFIYERSFKYLYIIGLPITIGTFVLARKIIFTIYGIEYFSDSIIILQILSWYIFIKFGGYLTGILLSSIDKQYLRTISQIITATVNIVLNIILIQRYSFIGAAISTVISEIVLFMLTYIFASKEYHSLNLIQIIYKPIIASAVMWVSIYYANTNLFLSFILGTSVYIGLILILRAFDSKDKEILIKMIKNE